MKPTKSNIYCPGCKHSKILFKTKKEAARFLQYNADEIEQTTGKRPVRTYFCKLCGGWHVTSRPYSFGFHQMLDRFGVEDGERLFYLIQPFVKPGKSIEKRVMDKIKALKRMLRHITIDIKRCQGLIDEISDVLGALLKTQVINFKSYEKLLDSFMNQVEIYTQKQGLN